MTTTDNGLTRLIFNVPARGMIGMHLNLCQ